LTCRPGYGEFSTRSANGDHETASVARLDMLEAVLD